jgi:phosphate/phosphite/phosphonate ABC transporter binding protein
MSSLVCALLFAAPVAAPVADPPLRLAIPAPLGQEQARKDAAELSALFTELLQRKVVAEVADARALPQLLASGRADLGWLSAAEYVQASAKAKVVPVAKLVRAGMPFYRSAIFTRAASAPRLLTALKGKRLAFVSGQSSAGNLLPRQLLQGAGFTEADLKNVKLLPDHGAVCKAVLDGEADAGATFANDGRGGALAGCEQSLGAEKTHELKVLATSDPIPNDVIALRPQAPAELQAALRKALLGLGGTIDGMHRVNALFHADAFVAAEDGDFLLLRQLQAGR